MSDDETGTPCQGSCHHCGAAEDQPCLRDDCPCAQYSANEDDPPSTPTERAQNLARRAQDAQDRLGWANPDDHMEVTHATVDLARVVTDLARELRALVAGSAS